MEHPSDETLKRFVAGTAARDESRIVVAHLLKGCASCARKVRDLMQPDEVRRDLYDSVLNRFDRGLVEGLESSISPVQTLRTVLNRLLEGDHQPPPSRKPPYRES
ncbi:MAG: hypothetical protein JF614_25835 [Acidobacteria bacterium]|nr:hypothetical protein [Acidobacteriota bacterium]